MNTLSPMRKMRPPPSSTLQATTTPSALGGPRMKPRLSGGGLLDLCINRTQPQGAWWRRLNTSL